MNKRGMDYTLLIRLFFVAVIIGLSLTVIVRMQDSTLYTELKTLHDISYLRQAASASPDKLSLNYYIPNKYEASFNPEGCSVGIRSIEKNELTALNLDCAKLKDIDGNLKTENGIQKFEIKMG